MSHQPHADADFVRDTSAEALSVFYEIQRTRPVGQKLVDVFDLSEGLFETVKAGIRLRYPDADERDVFLRAVASRVSRELMIRAYGWGRRKRFRKAVERPGEPASCARRPARSSVSRCPSEASWGEPPA
jgi:hypothetical protein